MVDFEVQRCTRRCHKLGRDFQPGETYFSVLERDGAEIIRRDYCAEAWNGPEENSIGWWKSQMPDTANKRPSLAPNEVIRDYFRQLETDESRADLRYLLGLLMVRRRLMRIEHSETDEAGVEWLVLVDAQDDCEYRLPVHTPTRTRVQQIQDELGRLLFHDR